MIPFALLVLAASPRVPPRDTSARAPVAYTIQATLDPRARVLHANERLAYRDAEGLGRRALYFHLYPNAFRDAGTAYAREHTRLPWDLNPLDWIPWGSRRGYMTIRSVRLDGRAAAFAVHGTVMRVPLASRRARDAALTIEIAFDIKLPLLQQVLGFRGSNYAMGLWYPKLAVPDTAGWRGRGRPTDDAFYADCSSYDVRLTVPSDVVVAASGEPAGATDNGDGTTTHRWRGEHVRYFAWVADRRYRVRRFTWNGVTVEYLHVDADDRSLERGVATIRAALAFYGARYGPYPHRSLVVAETPALGSGIAGVAYSQLVMLPAGMRHAPLRAPLYDGALAHEIAHQWWGMTVGIRKGADTWLNEGFAEFAAGDLERDRAAHGGAAPAAHGAMRMRRAEYVNQAGFGFDRKILQPDSAFDGLVTQEVAVYAKASFVLEMLQDLVGRNTLDDALRAYAARYRYRTARTADFIAVADSVARRDLTWFFDEWLEGTATCDYGIDAITVTRRPGGGYRSVITLRRNGGIVMPVELAITLEDGTVLHRTWAETVAEPATGAGAGPDRGHGRVHEIVIDSAAPVRAAVLDPDARLLETVRYNNYYPRRVRVGFLPRLSEDDAYDIVHLPFVFYDGGVELGLLLAGGRAPGIVPPTWVVPQHLAVAAAGYNLGTRTPVVGLAYSSSLGLVGRRAFWGVRATRDRTREEASVTARALFGPHFYRGPFHAVRVALQHERRFVANPWADSGTVTSLELSYSLRALVTDFYPLHGGVVAADVAGGWKALGSDWTFLRAGGRAAVYRRALGGTKLVANLFAGGIVAGTAPRQMLLRLAREGNFRAAAFDTVVGARLTALNAEIRVPLGTGTLLSVAAFAHVARYWGAGPQAPPGLQREAGVGLRLFDNASFGVQLDLPFWAGTGAGPATLDVTRLALRVGRPFHGPGP